MVDRAREPAIGDHAVLGDGRSTALVTRQGCVDWLCWPRFDSPAVFDRLLDPAAGGHFTVAPASGWPSSRRYLPGTNVLETRFESAAGALTLVDLMPLGDADGGAAGLHAERELLRLARCERGEVELEVVLAARPRFGAAPVRWRDAGALGLRLSSAAELFALRGEPRLPLAPGGGVRTRLRLRAGETARFSFTHATESPAVLPPLGAAAEERLARTARAWARWSARTRYCGPFQEEVRRSALTLKLLAHSPSGAIVAAATTSLPEQVGGSLNWDYRYCWLRDASLTVRALFGLGHAEEAEAFLGWLLHSTRLTRPALDILYDVYGRRPPAERELPLPGYRGSRPVRTGNAARDQVQLDVYGEVLDAAAQLVRTEGSIDRDTARMLTAFGDYVCRHWREPDEGLWEPRGGREHHTHSKVLCWAALDRVLTLAAAGHLPRVARGALARERAALREAIEREAWSDALQSYTGTFGGQEVDAALLQLPWYGYLPAGAPRMRATYRRVEEQLGAGRGLLYRHRRRDPAWREGAFGICGFWAAEYLALGGGTAAEAEARIAALLATANDLGLFAEEVDPATGEALGNFPQAFTHIGLVNACLTLQNRLTGAEQLSHQRHLPEADGGGAGTGEEVHS
nr:glycoside hydrolase family 15 protein [Anaeromyxobacter diazotrophicus]